MSAESLGRRLLREVESEGEGLGDVSFEIFSKPFYKQFGWDFIEEFLS